MDGRSLEDVKLWQLYDWSHNNGGTDFALYSSTDHSSAYKLIEGTRDSTIRPTTFVNYLTLKHLIIRTWEMNTTR